MTIHFCRAHERGMFVGLTTDDYADLASTPTPQMLMFPPSEWTGHSRVACNLLTAILPQLSDYHVDLCIAGVPGTSRQCCTQRPSVGGSWCYGAGNYPKRVRVSEK